MSDKETNFADMDDEDPIVVMTDEDGNEYYYREEMIIPINGKNFAILAPMDEDEFGCDCNDDCAEECTSRDGFDELQEIDVFIARIDIDESGEEIYVDPTEEEFEQVREAYEKIVEEEYADDDE